MSAQADSCSKSATARPRAGRFQAGIARTPSYNRAIFSPPAAANQSGSGWVRSGRLAAAGKLQETSDDPRHPLGLLGHDPGVHHTLGARGRGEDGLGLLEDAVVHATRGGFIDFTVSTTPELVEAGEVPALDAHRAAIEAGAPADRLSFSSDAGGSLPRYLDGRLAGLDVALAPGDLIYTGTPAGVGPVKRGEVMTGGIEGVGEIHIAVR